MENKEALSTEKEKDTANALPAGIKPQIILETDLSTDVDDAGAMAVLHALADLGECDILAIGYNGRHPNGAGAIIAINRYYGRGDLPVGVYMEKHPDTTDPSAYCEAVHTRFAPDVKLTEGMPDAMAVYRKVLSEATDQSVVIASVGFTQNLSRLVMEEPDLVARKVRELVIMGSIWNDGWNLKAHEMNAYTQTVIERWPGRIVFSPHGKEIVTGQGLVNTPGDNPVRIAYKSYYKGKEGVGRYSWDQLAVVCAVRGIEGLFTIQDEGEGRLQSGWTWQLSPMCISVAPKKSIAWTELIEELMTRPPKNRTAP